jgi:D-sedoheptulose 7-phosphate isomerase
LTDARDHGRNVFFIGNGGSASTAGHFANDLSMGTRSWTKPLRATSLCDNVSIITALGNDFSYAEIFVRQLQIHMRRGDVVVAISASGNSPNVVRAIEFANSNQGISVGITGFDGGQLAKLARIVVHVPTNAGEYGPAEDVHLILDHLVTAFLVSRFAKSVDHAPEHSS